MEPMRTQHHEHRRAADASAGMLLLPMPAV